MKKLDQILGNFTSKDKKRYSGKNGDVFDFLQLIKHWPKIIGEKLAKNTLPLKLVNGNLTIITNHSVFSQQLSLMEKEIILNIKKEFRHLNFSIEKLYFQTNPMLFTNLSEEGSKKKVEVKSSRPKLHPLSPEYLNSKKKAKNYFSDIQDTELKTSLESLFLQMTNNDDKDI